MYRYPQGTSEFKGDSGSFKYQTSLLNASKHSIIDILPSRDMNFLFSYFKRVPTKERQSVKFFVSDMSNTFKSVKDRFFKNSIHIVDRYHFIRQVSWALENVRKRIQKDISSKLRKYFKRSRSLLTKPASKLSSEQAKEVSLMLDLSNDLKLAYRLKELFYCVPCGYQYVLTQPNRVRASKSLREWIKRNEESNLKEFKACITAFNNWFDEICNSFDYSWSNGPLEGTHTKIKTLKRNCFGMKNFFGILKQEIYYDKNFYSYEELKDTMEEYIEYYDKDRIKKIRIFKSNRIQRKECSIKNTRENINSLWYLVQLYGSTTFCLLCLFLVFFSHFSFNILIFYYYLSIDFYIKKETRINGSSFNVAAMFFVSLRLMAYFLQTEASSYIS